MKRLVWLFFCFLFAPCHAATDYFYCSAQGLSGDIYYFSPVFEGQFDTQEKYVKAFADYVEKNYEYTMRVSCAFDGDKQMVKLDYESEIQDAIDIYGKVEKVQWLPVETKR